MERVDVTSIIESRGSGATLTASSMSRLFWRCKRLFGRRVVATFILPHLTYPDIIVLPQQRSVSWLQTRQLTPGSFRGCSCVLLHARQHYADSNASILRNFYRKKKQLLQQLGIRVLDIHFSDMMLSSNSRLDMLLRQIDSD